MKRRIMCSAVVVCFFLTAPAWAQAQISTQMPAQKQVKPAVDTNSIVSNIQSQLKLTQVGLKKITPIIDEENQKLSKILTSAQMNQWLNLLNSMRQKQKKSKHNTTAGGAPKSKI